MAGPVRRGISRRLLIGGGVLVAGLAWGGTTLARLARNPSGPKNAGRMAEFDGASVASPARTGLPDHDPTLPWSVKGGTLNDASALSETPVYGVVAVKTEDDISRALAFARANKLIVSIAAVRHSMGGHAFDDQALVLDMRDFNDIAVDTAARTVTVRPGATWHAIQNQLHPALAVKAMQSTDIFSVGGSISVNAHGMDHQAGSVAGSLKSIRVMLADGTVVTCSRTENTDLFRHVVGGYGLFGIILEATLEIVPNAIYQTSRAIIKSADFPAYFTEKIEPEEKLGLFYGHLSTAPANLMDDMIVYRYDRVADAAPADMAALEEPGSVWVKRMILNLAKHGSVFQSLKWFAETKLEPMAESCTVPRTAAMAEGEACLVSRNNPMHDSVPYLFNDLADETDILHEYFIPRAAYAEFIPAARDILAASPLPLLNASVRIVHAEDVALTYSPQPAFSLVLYINQKANDAGNAAMRDLTRSLVDVTLKHGGRFFLPYQLHYTKAQLLAAYPELPAFVAAKRVADPQGLFGSTFWRAISLAVPTV